MLNIYIKRSIRAMLNATEKIKTKTKIVLNKMRCIAMPVSRMQLYIIQVRCILFLPRIVANIHFFVCRFTNDNHLFLNTSYITFASIYIRSASFVITASHANFLFSLFIIRLRKLSFALHVVCILQIPLFSTSFSLKA